MWPKLTYSNPRKTFSDPRVGFLNWLIFSHRLQKFFSMILRKRSKNTIFLKVRLCPWQPWKACWLKAFFSWKCLSISLQPHKVVRYVKMCLNIQFLWIIHTQIYEPSSWIDILKHFQFKKAFSHQIFRVARSKVILWEKLYF